MKKKLLCFLVIMLMCTTAFAANKWRNGIGANTPLGATVVSDTDAEVFQYMTEPLDRLLMNYREDAKLSYTSASTVTIAVGELACKNAASTIVRFRQNTSTVVLDITADLDTGAEASSTTYYVYAVCDADATTFTGVISANSSTPQGGETYYVRLGSFLNDASSDITVLTNDNDNMIMATGTISNGGTIALPSGWLQDECDWFVAEASLSATHDQHATTMHTKTVSVNTSRVATLTDTAGTTTVTGNYLIVCHR